MRGIPISSPPSTGSPTVRADGCWWTTTRMPGDALPDGKAWLYEPKWDGFRCLAFRDGTSVRIQSKAGKPLGRYFPDVIEALLAVGARRFVLDGEIVIPVEGRLSFDELLLRV